MISPAFDEYVAARSGALLRFAYLLCGDRHLAEDLVQNVLIKTHRRWSAIEATDPDAYVRQALVRAHISWRRRRASSDPADINPAELVVHRADGRMVTISRYYGSVPLDEVPNLGLTDDLVIAMYRSITFR